MSAFHPKVTLFATLAAVLIVKVVEVNEPTQKLNSLRFELAGLVAAT